MYGWPMYLLWKRKVPKNTSLHESVQWRLHSIIVSVLWCQQLTFNTIQHWYNSIIWWQKQKIIIINVHAHLSFLKPIPLSVRLSTITCNLLFRGVLILYTPVVSWNEVIAAYLAFASSILLWRTTFKIIWTAKTKCSTVKSVPRTNW